MSTGMKDLLDRWETGAAPAPDAVEVRDAVIEALAAADGPTQEDDLRRWLAVTRKPGFLTALPNAPAREQWFAAALQVIDALGFDLGDLLTQRTKADPDRTLFRDFSGDEQDDWSYHRIRELVRATAAVLWRDGPAPELPVGVDNPVPGPRVGLFCDNGVGTAVCDLACLTEGLLVSPLNVHFKSEHLVWIFDRLVLTVAVCDGSERLDQLLSLRDKVAHPFDIYTLRPDPRVGRPGVFLLDEVRARLGAAEIASILKDRPRRGLRDIATVMFTSGSTGPAKGVRYTHGIFDAQTRFIQQMYDIGGGEVDLACFPLFGLFSMSMGMTVVIPDMDPSRPARVDPARLVEAIHTQGCTSAFGSPAIWTRLAPWCLERGIRLPSLRRVLIAGAPVPVSLHRAYQGILAPGVQLHTPYGATESLPVATIASQEVLSDTASQTERGAGTCVGWPAPGIAIRIIRVSDDPMETWTDALLLPQGEIGEITVTGPQVTREYVEDPVHTRASRIREGDHIVHRMGDLGYLDERGRLWFCGRKSHRVVTARGETLFPVPCEAIFNQHPDVFRTALVGVGAIPHLVVELQPGCQRDRGELERELLELGQAAAITRGIQHLHFHPGFPVDVRHNAKIFRERLAMWAKEQVR